MNDTETTVKQIKQIKSLFTVNKVLAWLVGIVVGALLGYLHGPAAGLVVGILMLEVLSIHAELTFFRTLSGVLWTRLGEYVAKQEKNG